MDMEDREWVRQTASLGPEEWELDLNEVCSQAEPVIEPSQWRVSRFNNPLQPVVGISLFVLLLAERTQL